MTRQQQALLTFIREHVGRSGFAPSYREMADALGLRSKAGVHRLVVALEKLGHIRRLPNHARSVELIEVDQPDNVVRNLIPVDPVTYHRAVSKAAEAGMTLADFAATALNSMGVQR